MKVLANDGISQSGIDKLKEAGFEVITTKVAQEQLANFINENHVEVLLVRSATTVRENLIDACPGLRLIGRGGVGMDNIDVDYARSKGIEVINTPAASSASVAVKAVDAGLLPKVVEGILQSLLGQGEGGVHDRAIFFFGVALEERIDVYFRI